MADKGKFIKVPTSRLWDEEYNQLSLCQLGMLDQLTLYIKQEGESGTILVRRPGYLLCAILRVQTFDDCINELSSLHLVNTRRNTPDCITISINNWNKEQTNPDQTSAERQRRYREKHMSVTNGVTHNVMSRSGQPLRNGEKVSIVSNVSNVSRKGGSRGKTNGLYLFDDFWKLYARKEAKGRARTAWAKLDTETKRKILTVLPEYPWSTDTRYIPLPATWLNDNRWEDEKRKVQYRPVFGGTDDEG